jgi:hypothetical protein
VTASDVIFASVRLALSAALLGLSVRATAPPPERLLLPLAPPLTRVAALGDLSLGPPAPPARPTARPPSPEAPALREAARIHRLRVEGLATELAAVLGPERVSAGLLARGALSAAVGERRDWDALAAALPASLPVSAPVTSPAAAP